MALKKFSKKPTTIEEQVTLLQKRGMVISDLSHAKNFLEYCSYYRFCGYALHFENLTIIGERTHIYKPGTSFSDVEQLYHFDAALRRIVFRYTSLIEIDFRGTLCNESACYYDNSHWFLDKTLFSKEEEFSKFITLCEQEIARSREIFVTSYKRHYNCPKLPPIWMLTELMPFAVWSRLYKNLNDMKLKKQIAIKQGIPDKYLDSWLQSLTVLRNACAHHARIWNRNFNQAPLLSSRISAKIITTQHKKIAVMLLIIHDMLRNLHREKDFETDMCNLIAKYSTIELKYLGIPSSIQDLFA